MQESQYCRLANAYKQSVIEPVWHYSAYHTIKQLISGGSKNNKLTGAAVLDVACGEGVLSRWAVAEGASRVLGVDLSRGQIEKARESAVDCGGGERISYQVADATFLNPAEVGVFDVAIGMHCLCYAQDETQLRAMVRSIASCLKVGGRFVGARECLDSVRGPAPMKADRSHGKIRFAWTMTQPGGGACQDFCKCKFEFNNSDGSEFQFESYPVKEATMLRIFNEEGFRVTFCGPLLTVARPSLFPEVFVDALINEYGSLMWYFDLIKEKTRAATVD